MASAILFVNVCVASCEKSCKRVTPLQLQRFFIRHCCIGRFNHAIRNFDNTFKSESVFLICQHKILS